MNGPRADEELIASYRAGRPAALRILDDWILPVVRHRSWSLREQEEDLLQEIRLRLLKLFESGAFRGDSSLKTYVRSTAKYTCLDAVRRARLRRTEELDEELSLPSHDHPDEELSRWDDARLCHLVLARLPELCRRLFAMVLQRELSYEQIAAETQVSLGTVKSRLARCRDRAVLLRRDLLAVREGGTGHEG